MTFFELETSRFECGSSQLRSQNGLPRALELYFGRSAQPLYVSITIFNSR